MKMKLVYGAMCSIGLMSALNGMEKHHPQDVTLCDANTTEMDSFFAKMFESYEGLFGEPTQELKDIVQSDRPLDNLLLYGAATNNIKPVLAVMLAQECGLDYCCFSADALSGHSFAQVEGLFKCLWQFAHNSAKKLMIIINDAEKLFPCRLRSDIHDNHVAFINFVLAQSSFQSSRMMLALISNKPSEIDLALIARCGVRIQIGELNTDISVEQFNEMESKIMRPSTSLLQKIIELHISSLEWPAEKDIKGSFKKLQALLLVLNRLRCFSKDVQTLLIRAFAGLDCRPFFLNNVRKNIALPLFMRPDVLYWLCDCTKARMLGDMFIDSQTLDNEIAHCVEHYFGPRVRQEKVSKDQVSSEDTIDENHTLQDLAGIPDVSQIIRIEDVYPEMNQHEDEKES